MDQEPKVCSFFLKGACLKGDSCRYLHRSNPPVAPPVTKTECKFFARGSCRDGAACRFLHTEARAVEIVDAPMVHIAECKFFARGSCRDGAACRFLHTEARAVEIVDAPMVHIAECKFFARGSCRDGAACRFLHTEARAVETPTIQPCQTASHRSGAPGSAASDSESDSSTDGDATEETVSLSLGGCSCAFGAGLEVLDVHSTVAERKVQAGKVAVSGLSARVPTETVERILARFGPLSVYAEWKPRASSASEPSDATAQVSVVRCLPELARARFENLVDAEAAVAALDATSHADWESGGAGAAEAEHRGAPAPHEGGNEDPLKRLLRTEKPFPETRDICVLRGLLKLPHHNGKICRRSENQTFVARDKVRVDVYGQYPRTIICPVVKVHRIAETHLEMIARMAKPVPLDQRVCVRLVGDSRASNSDTFAVSIQWYASCSSATVSSRVHFSQKMVDVVDGQPWKGRVVSAALTPQKNMALSNLPPDVTEDEVYQFVKWRLKTGKSAFFSVDRCNVYFRPPICSDDVAEKHLLSILRECEGFEVRMFEKFPLCTVGKTLNGNSLSRKPAKHKAIARFESAAQAKNAANTISMCQPRAGRNPTYFASTSVKAKITCLTAAFEASKSRVDEVISEAARNGTHVQIFPSERITQLRLQAERGIHVESQNALQRILAGEVVVAAAVSGLVFPVWHSDMKLRAPTDSRAPIAVLNAHVRACTGTAVFVQRNVRRRELRVFAPSTAAADAAKKVVREYVAAIGNDTCVIPLTRRGMSRFLRLGGGDALRSELGSDILFFVDRDQQDVRVRGGPDRASSVVAWLTKGGCGSWSAPEQTQDGAWRSCPVSTDAGGAAEAPPIVADETLCGICFCPLDLEPPPVRLTCEHAYCGGCFRDWLAHVASGGHSRFPLTCLVEGCTDAVPLRSLRAALPQGGLNALARLALDEYVRASLDFTFCITPDCEGLLDLRVENTESGRPVASCVVCRIAYCIPCQVQDHVGLTCTQYARSKAPVDNIRNHILENILTLKCPRNSCGAAFLDFDGCMALACASCPCHFCGWCLKDCGPDAHPHVRTCPERRGEDLLFAPKGLFEEAQRVRRERLLHDYLATLDPGSQVAAAKSIAGDVQDLGIRLPRHCIDV